MAAGALSGAALTGLPILLLLAALVALVRLDRRVTRLEQDLRALRSQPPALAGAPPPAAIAPAAAAIAPAPGPIARPPRRPRPSFEQLVGGWLPIWAGGLALALAGFFLVRYAIDAGLLTPPVRVLLASVFALLLLGLGEAAARLRAIAADPRVAQALTGAGIATLYAAAYLSSAGYALLPPLAGLVLLAAITAGALALSLRRGVPTAIMALVGGFATPLLAGLSGGTEWLLVYLALLIAGLFALALRRGWPWLALLATLGGFGWGLALLLLHAAAPLMVGLFVAALAAAGAWVEPAEHRLAARLRLLPLALGLVGLAILLPEAAFGVPGWGLYLLLSAASLWLARREAALAPAGVAALLVTLPPLAGTALGTPEVAAAVAFLSTLLFGGVGHLLARRAPQRWWSALAGLGIVLPLATLYASVPGLLPGLGWAAIALLLALPPLALAWSARGAGRAAAPYDPPLQAGAAAAAALVAAALALGAPSPLVASALLGVAALLGLAGRRIGDGGVARQAWIAVLLAAIGWLAFDAPLRALAPLIASRPLPGTALAIEALLLPGALLVLLAWLETSRALLIAGLVALFAAGAALLATGFAERMIVTQLIFAAGWLCARRGWPTAARWLTLFAAARMLWLDLLLRDPAWVAQWVGPVPIANLIGLHFALAAAWLALAWARENGRPRLILLGALILTTAGGALLLVRQAVHGALLTGGGVPTAEFYGYSLAGLIVASGFLAAAVRLGDRAMRIAALALLALVACKVFLVDAAALGGLLRIASFLGLGVALIAIGWGYGRLLSAAEPQPPSG